MTRRTTRSVSWAAGLLAITLSAPALGQPPAGSDLPTALQPWVGWVTHGNTTLGCSWVGQRRVCTWPGVLNLALSEAGGSFRQTIEVEGQARVRLPGDPKAWPLDVRANGRAVPLLEVAGYPTVLLESGSFEIEGRFAWNSPPEQLPVAPEVARVTLELDGASVSRIRRDDSGAVFLRGRSAEEGDVRDHLSLEVYRRIDDGVPMTIHTELLLRVAGKARELSLPSVLLNNTVPTDITSATLPARLEPDGTLTVQLRAGSHRLRIVALQGGLAEELISPKVGEPWPNQEIWVWSANESLRQVELSGGRSIDPNRTNLPEEWKALPATMVSQEGRLALETTRHGEPTPPPNQLHLKRSLWLSLDGNGYTVRDEIHGQLQRRWRLDLTEGALGRISINGEDQLVTVDEHPGIELRHSNLNMRAEWQMDDRVQHLPAVGWSEGMQSVSATLHLPPGWSLFATTGVDSASQSWVSRWDTWGLFYVLVLTVIIARLYGFQWGAVAAVFLIASYHQQDPPLAEWTFLVGLVALHRVTPNRWFKMGLRIGYWCVLLVLMITSTLFAGDQLKASLFPQAISPHGLPSSIEVGMSAEPMEEEWDGARAGAAAAVEDTVSEIVSRSPQGNLASKVGSGNFYMGRDNWVDPNAIVQTGPGLPNWSWQSLELGWSGPVAKDHHFGLWLLPPWLNRALGLLRVLLLGLLLWLFFAGRPRGPWMATPKQHRASTAGAAATAALLIAMLPPLLPATASAQSSIPTGEMLQELERRLVSAPACGERCVEVQNMNLTVDGSSLVIEAVVHAETSAGFPLPGPAGSWIPDAVSVNGRRSDALRRAENGFLLLRVPAGVHRVRLESSLASNALTLAFEASPKRLSFSANGWDVDGVRENGKIGESIQLTRQANVQGRPGDGQEEDPSKLPAWFTLTRKIDAHIRWTVTSTVRRVTPASGPAVLRVPLLAGEAVTDASLQVEDGMVLVSLGRSDTEKSWTSVLEPRQALELVAPPPETRRSETWILQCSPIWRCETEGINPTSQVSGNQWQPIFTPWPGDTAVFHFRKPEAAMGQSTTLDNVSYELRPGRRLTSATMSVQIRTSTGGPYVFHLPDGARKISLQVAGEKRPVKVEGAQVTVSLKPGNQSVVLEWEQPEGLGLFYQAPLVKVDGKAVNGSVLIRASQDRWLLWTGGPSWGPAVLFWPYLLLVVAIAACLARIKSSPLGMGSWILLGLGISQLPAFFALVVVGWFFAVAHRKTAPDVAWHWFDLRQLALIGYTLVTIGTLYAAVHVGLLVAPEVMLAGPSENSLYGYVERIHHDVVLRWYVDRFEGALPRPFIVSVPVLAYRFIMFAWSLWLAVQVFRWARWFWSCFREGGLWKPVPRSIPRQPAHGAAQAAGQAPAPGATPGAPAKGDADQSVASDEEP